MKRGNHYEVAFEAYLRAARVPYVAVDEARRALSREHRLKSFDFLVEGVGQQLLVDIKGRKFCRRRGRPPRWDPWLSQRDLDGLLRWEQVFGQALGLLVFAFWLHDVADVPPELAFSFRGRTYLWVGIPRLEYARAARIRSRRWGTLTLSGPDFIELARPLGAFLPRVEADDSGVLFDRNPEATEN